MTDTSQEEVPPKAGKGRAVIILIVLVLLAAGGGFALSYGGVIPHVSLATESKTPRVSAPAYIDLPQIVLTIPGKKPRTLMMSVTIDADQRQVKTVKEMSPRIIDSFNIFLSEIDPVAFERRGVLDIIKSEMTTRMSGILGADGFNDLLIMEFRVQ